MRSGYDYETEKAKVFTEENQEMFLKIRDKAGHLLKMAGAFSLDHVIDGCTGVSWTMMACVDRLVELGEIKEVSQRDGYHRVFVTARRE